jgi:hypothetical protein
MPRQGNRLNLAIALSLAFGGSVSAESLAPGLLRSDEGGAPGYQHSSERSRFMNGAQEAQKRRIEEHGFSKVIGPDGVFAVDLRNGLAVAVQSGGANKDDARAETAEPSASNVMDPDKHNEQVFNYLVSAGIPKDQIGGVHANTYLSASGSGNEERPTVVKVDGYASILERKIGNYPVVDSVAWARMDGEGKVLSEWVYWPAIPSKALEDARRLEEQVAPGKTDFVARLPAGLPRGKVVIRHSSGVADGQFEAYASYDVLERTESLLPAQDKNQAPARVTSVIVRHFDVRGEEMRLPQERRKNGGDFPLKQK